MSRAISARRDSEAAEEREPNKQRIILFYLCRAKGDVAGARKLEEQVLAASRRLLGEDRAALDAARQGVQQGARHVAEPPGVLRTY